MITSNIITDIQKAIKTSRGKCAKCDDVFICIPPLELPTPIIT